jgi:dTDP-4-amino-4,6-dideoxygalactose transaminase
MADRVLAVFSGEPRFATPLHVGRPNIGDRGAFLSRIGGILDRHWLTNEGELVLELERRLAERLCVRHCIAVCNGTAGLEIAIRALGLQGEVLVPSFTFVATAHALQWQGVTPVFCDIRPDTHTLDPRGLEKMITPRTTGIIGVHLWGQPCEIDALTALARSRNLRLLFDAAHAFGCSHQGRMIGNFGDAEVFSFHATKVFNTLEGGAIATNDDDVARRCRLMRNFGFAGCDQVDSVGTNGKMNEASAAMGLTNLESVDSFIAANRSNYQQYRAGLATIPGIRLMPHNDGERRNYNNIVIEVDQSECGLSRETLHRALHAEHVLARRYFWPGCHRMEPYRTLFPSVHLLLPETDRVASRVLSLPTGTAVSETEVHAVCAIIRQAVEHADELSAALA